LIDLKAREKRRFVFAIGDLEACSGILHLHVAARSDSDDGTAVRRRRRPTPWRRSSLSLTSMPVRTPSGRDADVHRRHAECHCARRAGDAYHSNGRRLGANRPTYLEPCEW
jgi:hypothetical protein